MHQLRRGIVRKIGGFAALCAILLLSFAPLASQAIEHAREDVTFATLCATSKPRADHASLHRIQACGYCDLATHASAPPAFVQGDHGIASWSETFEQARDIDTTRSVERTHTQPRAPPALA